MALSGRDLLDVGDLSDDEVQSLLDRAVGYAGAGTHPASCDDLAGKVVATCFFEPSTRTRLSFETAAQRLGARVIGFADAKVTSEAKGETLEDTARTVSGYADLIVVRHPDPGSAARFAAASDVPVVNAGDGIHAHPTQALLDLYTINKERGRTGDHHAVLLGDLKHGRTVHSLAVLLARFGNRLTFVAPKGLEMPDAIMSACVQHGPAPVVTDDLQSVIGDADILYVTRVQHERILDPVEHRRYAGSYIIDNTLLAQARKDVTILHPLPRVNEIGAEVDTHPGAAYFRQAANGVPVRMAILSALLEDSA